MQEVDAAAGPSNRQYFGYKSNRDRKKERKERRKVQFHESDDYSEEEGDVDAGDPVEEYDEEHDEENDDEVRAENAGPSNPKVFTIGTIGYPNVGKSSLINAIMGRNVSLLLFTTNLLKCFQYF